ncbi:MAG: hypothetical protein BZY88_10670 [SAR202 cluster bacterium Io17-Chloro-G9]|nr:MAG: hypothetical protein BZY88_10670 [SAR202 cluster bacterium Io17-Chloro-G9]
MSSFTQVLLEEGVEVELPARLSDVIALLDEDVPGYSCQGYGYRIAPAKGQIGSRWDLIVRSVNHARSDLAFSPVGRLEVERLDQDMVLFRIPPLFEQQSEDVANFDADGKLFGSFVYQVLNSFQRRQLIDLPGPLPAF